MELGQFTDLLQSQSHDHGHATHNLKIRVVRGGVWIEVEPTEVIFDATLGDITVIIK